MRAVVTSKRILFLTFILTLFSCSIDYGTTPEDHSGSPDFFFFDTTLTRVQNGKPRAILQAGTIEQYNAENCMYGDTLTFQLLSPEGDLQTSGTCTLFSLNQDTQIYTLLQSVEISSYDQDMTISANNLRWDNAAEQMTSDTESPITIQTGVTGDGNKTVTTITGTGLTFDGVTRTFHFAQAVTGDVITGDNQ